MLSFNGKIDSILYHPRRPNSELHAVCVTCDNIKKGFHDAYTEVTLNLTILKTPLPLIRLEHAMVITMSTMEINNTTVHISGDLT